MNRIKPHIVALKGFSNSGKTTSLESIVKYLTDHNKKVAVIKHIHRDGFSIDQKGKDTWKMRQAGGNPIVSYSKNEIAFLTNQKLDINRTIQFLMQMQESLDFIFLEGFWKNDYPKMIFFQDLHDFDNLIHEFLKDSHGEHYLQSSFCFSGKFFASQSFSKLKFIEKLQELQKSGILSESLLNHLRQLPIHNYKENPKQFLEDYSKFI